MSGFFVVSLLRNFQVALLAHIHPDAADKLCHAGRGNAQGGLCATGGWYNNVIVFQRHVAIDRHRLWQAKRADPAHRMADAKEKDTEAYKGRKPSYTREQLQLVTDMLTLGSGISDTAKLTGVSRQTVYRIKEDPAAAEKALAVWGG